jgi:hypothetical protein
MDDFQQAFGDVPVPEAARRNGTNIEEQEETRRRDKEKRQGGRYGHSSPISRLKSGLWTRQQQLELL